MGTKTEAELNAAPWRLTHGKTPPVPSLNSGYLLYLLYVRKTSLSAEWGLKYELFSIRTQCFVAGSLFEAPAAINFYTKKGINFYQHTVVFVMSHKTMTHLTE